MPTQGENIMACLLPGLPAWPPVPGELADDGLMRMVLAARVPMVIADATRPDHPLTAVNDAFCSLTGYRPDEVIGRNCRFLQCAQTDPRALARLRCAIDRAEPIELELRNQRRDGTLFWNRVLIAPVFDAAGQVIRFFASLLDVTAERTRLAEAEARGAALQAEAGALRAEILECSQALAISQERLRETAAAARAVAWEGCPHTGEAVWSDGFEALFGVPRWPPGAAGHAAWLDLVLPEDRARATAGAATAAAGAARFDYRIRRDGDVRWLESISRVTARDADGRVVRASGIVIDVTEQRTAERLVQEVQQRFQTLLASMAMIVWVTDADGQPTYASPGFIAFTGLPSDAVRSDQWTHALHPDERASFLAEWTRCVAGRMTFERETQLRRHDGEYRWFLIRGEPQRDPDGTLFGWCGTATDIEVQVAARAALARSRFDLEQQVAERTAVLQEALRALQQEADARAHAEEALRQAQKMEAVGQLAGGIAHDFNNLLTAITGSLDLLQSRLAQGRIADADRFLEMARRAVDRGGALTHRLLAFGRRQALDPKPVLADRLVSELAELITRSVGPQIEVRTRLGSEGVATLCDAHELQSALLNLAINARDAMPDGGQLTLTTSCRHVDEAAIADIEGAAPGDYVAIAVSDTGHGMTEAVRSRAFDPFFTTKPSGQGTGLGLSHAYGFVRQSGGFVTLESAPAAGTIVTLVLPCCGWLPELPAPPVVRSVPPPAVSVLLVEDEANVRELIAEALQDSGCVVTALGDAEAALSVLEAPGRFDVLVTDVGLPGLNGRALADAARASRPDMPVLLMTGYAGDLLRDLEPGVGMEVLGKPFTMATLSARIATVLGRAA